MSSQMENKEDSVILKRIPPPVPPRIRRNSRSQNLTPVDENSESINNGRSNEKQRQWSSTIPPIISQPKSYIDPSLDRRLDTAESCLDVSTTANTSISNHVKHSKSTSQLDTLAMAKRKNSGIIENRRLQSAKQLSISSPAMSPSPTRTNEDVDDVLPRSSQGRNKKFHKLFTSVPEDEFVLDYFSCAFIAEILLQGHLYITDNYFGFYSNVFGHITKILIPIETVTHITKERTAKIIPNAVGVTTQTTKYTFGSLLSRYTTFCLMTKVWRRATQLDLNRKLDSEEDTMTPELERVEDESVTTNVSRSSSDGALANASNQEEQLQESLATECLDTPKQDQLDLKPTMPASPVKERVQTDNIKAHGVFTTCLEKIGMVLPVHKLNTYLSSLTSLPRTTLFLLICTILLVFLYMSAVFLIYRLNTMQYRYGYHTESFRDNHDSYREAYRFNSQMHAVSVGHLRESLALHIQQLAEVRKSLETLQFLVSEDGSSNTFQNINNGQSMSSRT